MKVGDKVSKGTPLVVVEGGAAPAGQAAAPAPAAAPALSAAPVLPAAAAPGAAGRPRPAPAAALPEADLKPGQLPHASPSVRKFARELGVDLARVPGSGPKGRITQDDVRGFVKQALAGGAPAAAGAAAGGNAGGLNVLAWPQVDFSKFGPVERQAAVAHQEDFRREPAPQLGHDPARHQQRRSGHHRSGSAARDLEQGKREEPASRSPCSPFLIKAVVAALKKFPEFNASLGRRQSGATSTTATSASRPTRPTGWCVPVHPRCRQEIGILDIARRNLNANWPRRRATASCRRRKCRVAASRFPRWAASAASHFTPIINAPEVAILGVSRAEFGSRHGTASSSCRA